MSKALNNYWQNLNILPEQERPELHIIELPSPTRDQASSEKFLLLRRFDNVFSTIWTVAPVFNLNANDDLDPQDLPELKMLSATFDRPTSGKAISLKPIRSMAEPSSNIFVDFKNIRLLDIHGMLKTGQFPKLVGKTLAREFSLVQITMNKMLEQPPVMQSEGYRQFLALTNPGTTRIHNSIWDNLLKHRSSPVMDKAELLNHLESMRSRVQYFMVEYNLTVNKAKDQANQTLYRDNFFQSLTALTDEGIDFIADVINSAPNAIFDLVDEDQLNAREKRMAFRLRHEEVLPPKPKEQEPEQEPEPVKKKEVYLSISRPIKELVSSQIITGYSGKLLREAGFTDERQILESYLGNPDFFKEEVKAKGMHRRMLERDLVALDKDDRGREKAARHKADFEYRYGHLFKSTHEPT